MSPKLRGAVVAIAGLAIGAGAFATSPYAGMAERAIKALSAEQIADLNAGRGMGLALAAELNGWPGPLHVLELADRLALTPDQRARTQALFGHMQSQARAIGERLIGEEAALDQGFRDRTIAATIVDDRLRRIGALQGELRAVHLRTHLDQAEILTSDQIGAYNRLRGYASDADGTRSPQPAPSGSQHRHGVH